METRECCCIFYKKSEGMPRMMQTNSCKGTVYVVKERIVYIRSRKHMVSG